MTAADIDRIHPDWTVTWNEFLAAGACYGGRLAALLALGYRSVNDRRTLVYLRRAPDNPPPKLRPPKPRGAA